MSTQTSLSRQLQRLKVPQTSAQKERKGSVSFLYDFVSAKSIDNDMHYAIAISGLNQLIEIEPNIQRFTQTLFSESSKTLDRALQSREANHDLDQEIESFLFSVVSNYFLLVATHKTIEWLIYRYRVNEYNVEALIACVMPYHETRLFARLIQTCPDPKVETNKWFWLKPIQISGSPLPKTTLITHCISDTGFLRFICDYMIRSLEIEPKGNSFSPFFTSTLINVIQRNTSEAIVSIIMSYVMKGIKSKNDFFKKASYCITAHLCTRIIFDKKVINKILSAIAKKSKSPLSDEILIMLSIMDRFQHLDSLPLDLIKSIDEKSLIKTHNSHNIDNLNACLLKSLINYCVDLDMKDKLIYLLNELNLSPLSVQTCIQTISLILKGDGIQIPIDTFSKVLSLIERRYPVWFDETLSKLDSLASIAPLLGAFKYSFVKSAKVPLVIGLNHVNESIRKEAINHLVKNFDILLIQKDESTISTIKSVLIDLFKHNSPQTLISLFGLKQKMFELFNEEEMTEICQNLLSSCHTKEEILDNEEGLYWYQLKNSILATYCSISYANNDSYYCFIYPYLLPLNDSDLDTLAIILDSKGSKTSNILGVLWQKCKSLIDVSVSERDVVSITTIIIDEMANYYIERHDLISDSNFVQKNRNVYNLKSCVLSVLILSRINSISKDDNIKQKCGNIIITLIELIMKCTKISKPKSSLETYKDFLHNCLKNLRRNRISLSNVIFIINSLINSIDSSIRTISQSSLWFWHKEFVSNNNYYYNLFNLIFNNSFDEHKRRSSAFREILLNFVKIFFGYIGFDFFAALWANNENLLLQIRSLAVSSNLGQSNCPVNKTNVLSLLISMHSPLSNSRELAINIAKRLSIGNSDGLLLHCLEHSELIKSDENQISYAIAKWFKSNFESKSTKKLTKFDSLKKEWIEWIRDEKTPDYIKSGIVLLLNKCEIAFVSQILIAMNSYLDITSPNVSQFKIIESLLSIYCETDIFQNVVSERDIVFSFFIKSLRTKHTEEIAVNLINKDLFSSLTCKEAKISLMKQLLEMIINHNNKVAKKKFKKLLNDGNLTSSLLEYLIPINEAIDSSKTSKRMRTISQTEFSLESNEWKMFIISLEVIQSKKSIKDVSILVKSLFEYLKMTFIMESKSSLEYLRQLILSSLINCMKQSEDEIRYVQIESVIECLRESQQRETQKIALILISSVASNFKKEILDYVITIFTFIGNNLLHCDDQYTMQIVFDTMEAIIPILLNDVKDTKDSVINVFVDSLPDIPSHRRLHLFRKLLNMLGEKDHLWLIFMKIVERTLNKSKVEKQPFFSLAVALCSQCDISVQIDSLNHIMQVFATDFVDERRVLSKKKHNLSESDRKVIAYNLAQVLLQVVSSQEFIITTTNSEWNNISQSLSTFLHSLIALIVKFTVIENESVFKDANNHRRRIRNILYQILMRFNSILPNQQLIELVLELLQNDSHLIQRKALELLNEKLAQLSIDTLTSQQLNHLLKSMITIVPTIDSINQMDEQHIYNSQLSMITMKLLSKHIGDKEESQQYVQQLISQLISLINGMKAEVSVNFKASCILCLTQLMITLGNNAIPLLPSIMPIILGNFNISDEVIVISNITAISKISQYFPQFLSSFLDQIIIKLLTACNNCSQIASLKMRLKTIWTNFAKMIPKRILISSLDSCYANVSSISHDSLCELMTLLKLSLEHMNKNDVNSVLKPFKNLMLNALDFRNLNHNTISLEDIEKFENSCNEAFSVFIPKMSEITFRPLFYKLYDWAIREKNGKLYHRMISFYRLSQFLSDKLKSLFCIFIAPSIVNNSSQMLSLFHSNNVSNTELDCETAHILICSILGTLSKCFMYDINSGFLTKERMQALTKPIIDQLTNTLGTGDHYNQRLELLCLCTQYLIQDNKDEAIIKDFNYHILLKTREISSEVRVGALRMLDRLILVSGEEYLPLIPETIPFIAELSEDDSNDVEDVVKTVITDLEQILGEPISKYL